MGGGGDGGYAAKQMQIERQKQQARDLLNMQFGYQPSAALTDEANYVTNAGRKMAQVGSTDSLGTGLDLQEKDRETFTNTANTNRSGRESLYQTVRDNAFNTGRRRLDEDKADAARKTKFELFARGLAGGSEDIDQNARLRRTYNDGLLNLGAKADAAKAGFQSDDEATRLQLLQSIDAGMDQGSALSQAAARMQIASGKAAADATGTDLGNLFDSAGLIYSNNQAAQGRQAAQSDWWNNLAPKGRNTNGNPAAQGVVSTANVYG